MLKLIHSIKLLSDAKSFVLHSYNTKDKLWILLHLKNLKIKTFIIHYRKNTGVRQRAKTVYPIRKMRKQFTNTANLLHYLENKRYELLYLQIFFENGWSFKEECNSFFRFYTNSTSERDELINRFMSIAGYDTILLKDFKFNIWYYLNYLGEFEDLGFGKLPDEFWSEEKINNWKIKQEEIFYPNKKNDQEYGVPFVSKIPDPFKNFSNLNFDDGDEPPF